MNRRKPALTPPKMTGLTYDKIPTEVSQEKKESSLYRPVKKRPRGKPQGLF
jgi:hypothetical protein